MTNYLICGKDILKKIKKGIDKIEKLCYNKHVKRTGKSQTKGR
jgi:hypothetical protein